MTNVATDIFDKFGSGENLRLLKLEKTHVNGAVVGQDGEGLTRFFHCATQETKYCQNPNHNLNTTQGNLNCSWV